ncbi:snare associated Golgi protein [Rhizophagus diaphanus]|nr:snare associated Golgi protein [Rhizophagus diaphanus] [Rhizophagus sp. MUCL 43196]
MSNIIEFFREMPRRKKLTLLLTSIIVIVLTILFFIFEKPIMRALAPVAEEIRDLKFGYLIIGGIIIASSIPPIPGYGSMIFICGFIYGFPLGFAPAYIFALLGASFSFFVCRSICLGYARKLTKKKSNFQKLALAIEEGGFKIIFLIRLSPFPFPWSNAFFGTIQTVSFWKFFLATALSLPKLLIYIFIGSRFRNLTEEMDSTSRTINYVTLAVGSVLLFFAAWYIYRKMNASVNAAAVKRLIHMEESSSLDRLDLSEIDSSEIYADELVVDEVNERGKLQ